MLDGVIDRDRNSVEFGRVLALSDGIFAFAMTLLVIAIALPAGLGTAEFPQALGRMLPKVAIMALSIAVIASAWIAHHRLFAMLQRIDGGLIGLNIVTLGLVALMPFPHQVLGDYPHEPLSYVLYAAVLGSVNVTAVAMDVYVRRRFLLRADIRDDNFRNEVLSGLVVAAAFAVSIPLAFVLVGLTPLVWIAALPVDRLLARRRSPNSRTTADSGDGAASSSDRG